MDREKVHVTVSGCIRLAVNMLLGAILMAASPVRAADRALIDAARKEGKVAWYTTLIVNQAIRPLQQAFERKYPGVRLEYSRADDSPTALKILTEARAGRVQADIFDGLYNMMALRRARLLAPYRPPNVDQFSQASRDSDGQQVLRQADYLPALSSIPPLSPGLRPEDGGFQATYLSPPAVDREMPHWSQIVSDLFR
jgi:hypothetical protein